MNVAPPKPERPNPWRMRIVGLCSYYQRVRYPVSCVRGGAGRGLAQATE